jgi:hypothetical protein
LVADFAGNAARGISCKATMEIGDGHAQDFHPFRSGVRLGDDGHRDGGNDGRDLGHRRGTGDPLIVMPYLTPFLSSYLLLVTPGVLAILLAVLRGPAKTERQDRVACFIMKDSNGQALAYVLF